MGAYSPAPVVTQAIHERVMREVIRPTIAGMAAEGHEYTGFLYAGLMITADGTPKVLEFNCRFGDPETQPIMMRLRSDLVSLCEAALDGRLDTVHARWDSRPALGVVMAAGGYPAGYDKGRPITGLDVQETSDALVFHAGTAMKDETVVTSGGRVLCVVGLGDSVADARDVAYDRVRNIHWEDVYFRNDIGHRAIARERA